MQIKCNGITFHSLKFSSYNFLTQEQFKLTTFKLIISTFFRPPVSKVMDKVLCFILGCEIFFFFFFVFFEVLRQLLLEHQLSRQGKQSLILLAQGGKTFQKLTHLRGGRGYQFFCQKGGINLKRGGLMQKWGS